MQEGRAIAQANDAGYAKPQLVPLVDVMPLRAANIADPNDELARDDFRRLVFETLRLLFKRKGLIAFFALVAVTVTAAKSLTIVPTYTATVRIQIDARPLKIVEGGQVEPIEGGADYLRTQVELLQGRTIAERVAKIAKLADDPDFFAPRQHSIVDAVKSLMNAASAGNDALQDREVRERVAPSIVAANQTVRVVSGSRLVDISYADPDPHRAQLVANAYAQAIVAANLDKRLHANVYAKAFLEDQLSQLKVRLEDAEKAVISFAEKEEFVLTSDKASMAEANLSAANAALGALIAERIKAEQLWRQVDAVDELNIPQFLLDAVIQGHRTARNALDSEYKEKLETFKPAHPTMIALRGRMKEVDRQIAAEIKTIKASHKAAFQQVLRQETETRARIEELRVETLDLQRRGIQYNNLRREANAIRTLYEGLMQRHREVDVAGGIGANNIFMVERASHPGTPSSTNLSRALMIALMLGLGGGLGAALLLERLDDAVRSPDQVERLSGLPTLGVIPELGGKDNVETAVMNPRSLVAEAYRSTCTALQFATVQGLPRSVLVTSAVQGEGKSIASLAIGRHYANMGLRVLIVDADLRNPSMHRKLALHNSVGLVNYLADERPAAETFQQTDLPQLKFMAAGPLPLNAADLLASPRLHSLLSVGLESFDLIVIDCPPVMGLADAQLLSNAAAATLFVVGAGQTRPAQIRGAIRRLQLTRSPLVGTVLTKFDVRNAAYGDEYAYGYGYGGNRRIERGSNSRRRATRA